MISDWKFSGTKKHNGTDGAWFSEPKTAECTFSVKGKSFGKEK